MPVAAAIGLGAVGSVVAAGIGANAQENAAQQAIAAQKASLAQGYNYANTQAGNAASTLSPFIDAGGNSLAVYNYLTGSGPTTPPPGYSGANGGYGALTAPFSGANLASTPGYQFALQQGLKGVQNSYAAQGLGSSGSALKGAAQFATGTAQNTYNQQFQNYLAQNQQIANMFLSGGQIGEAAGSAMAGIYGNLGAAGLGGAVQTGQGIAGSLTGAGNAIAGAATGAANALQGGINTGLQYSLLSNQLANQNQMLQAYLGNSNSSAYLNGAYATSGADSFAPQYSAFTYGTGVP